MPIFSHAQTRRYPAAIALALFGGSVGAQNLLVNPGFAGDLSGWTFGGTFTYVPLDSTGQPGSGCAQGRYIGVTGATTMHQCVPVMPGGTYEVGGTMAAPAGEFPIIARISVQAYGDAACATAAVSTSLMSQSALTAPDVWQAVRSTARVSNLAHSAAVSVLVSRGSGITQPGRIYVDDVYLRPVTPAKGDTDGDLQSDLVFQDAAGALTLWHMNGRTRTNEVAITPTPSPGLRVAAVDTFNDDGHPDLVLRDPTNGAMEFWWMEGTTRLGTPGLLVADQLFGPEWELAASGDFDHDGYADFVWRHSLTQKLVIWRMYFNNKLGEIVPTPDQAVARNWKVVAALDYDRDGHRDLLWYNVDSGRIVLWRMDSNVVRLSGAFTSPPTAGDANWEVVAGGEFGSDGVGPARADDIVWRNRTTGKLVIWHMDAGTNPLTRVAGGFTTPDAPSQPLAQTVVGPR
jgi:hypothetical protein